MIFTSYSRPTYLESGKKGTFKKYTYPKFKCNTEVIVLNIIPQLQNRYVFYHTVQTCYNNSWPIRRPRTCCSTSPARRVIRGRIDGWMTLLLPSLPAPAVSSLPDFPTLPPVPWRPARRTARLRRRKTTTRRERKAPSRPHGSLSTTSP